MADAVGAAGTAVGVVSLGIQVCQGLWNYVETVRARDAELEHASNQLKDVTGLLQQLQDLLPKIESLSAVDVEAARKLQQCMAHSQSSIDALQKMLQSLEKIPATDIKGKVKDFGRMLAFGFKQDGLVSLQEKVSALALNVQIALQILQSYVTVDQHRQISEIIERQKVEETSIRRIETTSNTSGIALSRVETTLTTITHETSETKQSIKGLEAKLDLILSQAAASGQGLVDPEARALCSQSLQSPSRLREKPDALRQVHDLISGAQSTMQESHLTVQQRPRAFCNCRIGRDRPTTQASTGFRFGGVSFWGQATEISQHSVGCAWRKSQKQQVVATRLIVTLAKSLGVQVAASLAYNFGAGGCSIAPKLEMNYITRDDPARELIWLLWIDLSSAKSIQDAEKYITRRERQIMKLFQDGMSSPHNRDEHGQTILHLLVENIFSVPFELPFHGFKVYVLQFMKTLNSVGVPYEAADAGGRTILDMSLHSHRRAGGGFQINSEAATFVNLFNIVPSFSSTTLHKAGAIVISLSGESRDTIEEFDFSPLQCAILAQDEQAMLTALSTSPQSVYDRLHDLTALHLSVKWATGICLLLRNGAHSLIEERCLGYPLSGKPLQIAIQLDCVETLQILLEKGASFRSFENFHHSPVTGRIVRCVAKELASRRRQLRDLAKKTLTATEWLQFEPVKQDEVPDAQAALLCRLIESNGIRVPEFLSVPPEYEGILFSGGLHLSYFPIFYEEGFHDINRSDSQGFLPLTIAHESMCLRADSEGMESVQDEFETFQWLLGHSCLDCYPKDPLLQGINKSATGWHLMIEKFWYGRRNPTFPERPVTAPILFDDQDDVMHSLNRVRIACLRATVEDSCNCSCSVSGCQPFHLWLKFQVKCRYSYRFYRLPQRLGGDFPLAFLRFITFEALGIPHTCCNIAEVGEEGRHSFGCRVPMSFRGDVEEVLGEHQSEIEKLEALMLEFRNRWEASVEGDLHSFISQYWRRRMAEECIPLEEDFEALKNAGVRVYRKQKPAWRLRKILGRNFRFDSPSTSKDLDNWNEFVPSDDEGLSDYEVSS